ncbi:cytochrome P450 [Aneurinibacillus sp. REN35]|uniref:cytochrome P450 n=1 Tax=Aneurinibacillus sp. REN35 TaxID=3237286 RepID=UPI003526E99D
MEDSQDRPGVLIPIPELTTDEGRTNPFPWFAAMRDRQPARYDEVRGCWDLFRYDDVKFVLKNPKLFSSARQGSGPVLLGSIISMDPPRHTAMRSIVSKAFTPKTVADLTPRIASITHELLDAVTDKKEMDVVYDLAYPLPVIVIAELLGVPAQDRQLFKDWSDMIVKGPKDTSEAAFAALLEEKWRVRRELDAYFLDVIGKRRTMPQDDLITRLVEAELDGDKLTDEEVLEFCILLLAAGNETTTNLLTNAVRRMVEQPELFAFLRQSEENVKLMIEEVLRFYPPILATNRIATEDTQVAGQQIKKGQQVSVWIGSANRDASHFTEPNRFVADRNPNPHMGFGFGIHFCLGAPLARLEAQVALGILLQRIIHIQFIKEQPWHPIPSPFVYGTKELQVRFDT